LSSKRAAEACTCMRNMLQVKNTSPLKSASYFTLIQHRGE
jgi:hypothetical protein